MDILIDLWQFATAWYNLPFTLALLAFLGLSFLQFLGLDQDPDADIDVDLDHDVDLGYETGLDHDFDHDLNPELEHDIGDLSNLAELMQFLGVGQIPATMILLLLMGGFGLTGWLTNALLLNLVPNYPGWIIVPVFAVALFSGVWFTSRTSRLIGRLIPAFTTTATPIKHLVSRQGRVVSPQVDQTYGQVKVRDGSGTLITVFAVVDPGRPPLVYDTEVFLVEYDRVKKVFVVEPSEM